MGRRARTTAESLYAALEKSGRGDSQMAQSRFGPLSRDEVVKTYEPAPRCSHGAASLGGLEYCFAGATNHFSKDKTSLSTHIEVFDPCIETWLQRETAGDPPLGLINGAFAASHSHLYHYGGWDVSSSHGDLSRFCPARSTMLWTNASRNSASGPMKKNGCRMICCGDTLGLFGGYTTGSKYTDEFHLFDISKGIVISLLMELVMHHHL